jgi:rod shape-determining protein MreC
MQQIINFFIRNKNFILFLLLFSIALSLTIQSHSYHKSKFINSANFLTGGIYESVNKINQYFYLKKENQILLEENNKLKSLLFNSTNEIIKDTSNRVNYITISASVNKNSFTLTNNYLTLNKGTNDSISEDLGVITSKGIVGIIDNTSKNYSRVMSILNTNSRINAQLKKSNHFGTLIWNTNSAEIVQLVDIPKQAPIVNGDTIITGGRSTIFPKNIPIGEVVDFVLDETENFYTVDVRLFNDMTNIGHVHIIKNIDTPEIKDLENSNE